MLNQPDAVTDTQRQLPIMLISPAQSRFLLPLLFCTANMRKRYQVCLFLRAMTKQVWAWELQGSLVLTVAWHYVCYVYSQASTRDPPADRKKDEGRKGIHKAECCRKTTGTTDRRSRRRTEPAHVRNHAWTWSVAKELVHTVMKKFRSSPWQQRDVKPNPAVHISST